MSRICALWFAFAATICSGMAGTGVVVESVEPAGGAALSGIEEGQWLLGWERRADGVVAARGPLESPFELERVEIEEAPLGPIRLVGDRVAFDVPPEEWLLRTRPVLDENRGNRLDRLLAAIEGGEIVAALDTLSALASGATDDVLSVWFRVRTADALGDTGAWSKSDALYDEATAASGRVDPSLVAAVRRAQGNLAERHGRQKEAIAAYGRALEAVASASPNGLDVADLLWRSANVSYSLGDLDAAETQLERALELAERTAPESYSVAKTVNTLGKVAFRRGELDEADRRWRRALRLNERLAPEGRGVINLVNNLGVLSWRRGDLAAAENFLSRALRLRQRDAPRSRAVATILVNLGGVAGQRGNLPLAEAHLKRAVELAQDLEPDGVTSATALNNLGNVCWTRGDRVRALEYYERSLAIKRERAPKSILLSHTLNNLARVAMEFGDPENASRHAEEALAIREQNAPDGIVVSQSHHLIGDLQRLRGDRLAAREHYRRGLAVLDRLAPDSLEAAMVLNSMGDLAFEEGDDGAERLHRRALAIRQRRAPGSVFEAESAAAVGRIQRRRGESTRALASFRRAVDALEAQQVRLGGVEEDRVSFRARNLQLYRDTIDLLVELGRSNEAFLMLERSRARGLLTMLAERDLVFSADLPGDLDLRRRRLGAEYDRIQEQLAELSTSADSEPVTTLLEQLERLRRRRAELFEEIREAAPRLAALEQPVPLDLERSRAVLDPGTALLSYSVGENATHLFVIRADGDLDVHTIDLPESDLRRRVVEFRKSIEQSSTAAGRKDTLLRARRLFRTLVSPAEASLTNAKRILIAPDGPLHVLPFAALVRPGGDYFIEWKPIHVVASTTLYAELREARRNGGDRRTLLAFGDPSYPAQAVRGDTGDAVLGGLVAKGRSVKPLPASRDEVLGLKALYGDAAQAWLGADATETRAKAIDGSRRLIHFAAHAFVDERFPLDSAIALSIPERYEYGRDNGLLQAWEIFESVRIDADLVTLSACGSALGREMPGEGIVGLTRAFQYAGARSVLASLWSVGDRGTAVLMKRFYVHLQAGRSKDEALRAAQLEMIRGPQTGTSSRGEQRGVGRLTKGPRDDHRSPYHWAAFQLFGDWR